MATRLWFNHKGQCFQLTDEQALSRLEAGQHWLPAQPINPPKEPTMSTPTGKRVVFSHKNCKHPSTSNARKECREQMAKAAEQAAAKAKKPAPKKAAPKAEATAAA